jgi:O-antigen/teichoic acid export membrane protein
MGKLKRLAGETVLYGLGNIVPRLLNFLLFPIHTAFFAPEEYGVFTYLMSAVAMVNVLYSFGMETAYFRFATKPDADPKRIFNIAQTVVVTISILLSALFLVSTNTLAQELGVPDRPHYIYWLIGILFIDSIVTIPFARLRLEKKPLQFASFRIANIVLLTSLNVVFLYSFYDASIGIGYIILANLIANTFYIFFFSKTLFTWRPAYSKEISPAMFRYAYPVMLTGLAGMTNEFFSRLALEKWLPKNFYLGKSSAYAVGVLGAAYKFSVFMNLAVQAFRMAAEPFFFAQASNKNSPALFAKVNHYFVVVCCFIMIAIAINVDVLKYIFLQREEYWEGLVVVAPLLLGYLLLGVYYNFTVWFKLTDKTYYGTIITIGGALLTIAINYLLIPSFGYAGSSWATVICFFCMVVVCYLLGQKFYPIPYRIGTDAAYILVTFSLIYMVNAINISNQIVATVFHAGVLALYTGVVYFIEKSEWRRSVT